MIKINLINNWKYKANWPKNHFVYVKDGMNNYHLIVGLFNFYIFVAWR